MYSNNEVSVEQENKLFMMKIPSKLWKSVQKYENYDYVNK